jgi:hypothetical protein
VLRCFCFCSLAQEFIFSHLSDSVSKHFDSINVHLLKEAAGNSSHVPFLFALRRLSSGIGATADVVPKKNKKKSAFCFFKDNLDIVESKSTLNPVSMDKCWSSIQSAQDSFKIVKLQADLRVLKPGRIESIELWMGSKSVEGSKPVLKSKYTLTILDINNNTPVSVSAFIVPQGREHEFLFSSEDGLKQIAQSASCSRLLSFALNRGHVFNSLEDVKMELNQSVIDFSPESFSGRIPFITTQDGAGCRNAVAEGRLSYGDEYIVEEAEIEGRVVRRLVFMTNSSVIQTEVRLIKAGDGGSANDDDWGVPASGGGQKKASSSSKKSNSKKNKKSDNKKVTKEAPVDKVHSRPGSAAQTTVDFTYMCFDYHRAILAGMIYLLQGTKLLHKSESTSLPSGVVVGLGGGALPMMLHHFFPECHLIVAELDNQVYQVAKEWFGFVEDKHLTVDVTDGLVMELGINSKAFVILDVDSKDPSVSFIIPFICDIFSIYYVDVVPFLFTHYTIYVFVYVYRLA